MEKTIGIGENAGYIKPELEQCPSCIEVKATSRIPIRIVPSKKKIGNYNQQVSSAWDAVGRLNSI